MTTADFDLKEMKANIEKIEQHAMQLKALGAGVPVVEKNTRIILSIVNNLRFGIADPADLMEK